MYSYNDVITFIQEEDVKFIRLAFCDIHGKQKNISIMPHELKRAFEDGISFDASAIDGFGREVKSDLLLFPDPSTLAVLPWRPTDGRVIRMFCDIKYPDGVLFENDSRYILKQAIEYAKSKGLECYFGAEFEFYLFKTDDEGDPTAFPFDNAGYMDIAPEDKGENIRREICFTLLNMGIKPEASHHEEGPGQNEIDFLFSDALTAADNATTFKSVVKTIAIRNGLYADFNPKPLSEQSGSGMHINMSVKSSDNKDYFYFFMAGVMAHIKEITLFLNPTEDSYKRFGGRKAPKYITWSPENRSQLIRIPAAKGNYKRIELRSPDPTANPYLAYALIIYSGIDGIKKKLVPEDPTNINLFTANSEIVDKLDSLPSTLQEAIYQAENSVFLSEILSMDFVNQFKK